MSGLRHNYELNVDVLDFDAAMKLDDWFVARWDDKFSIDITDDLVKLIDESWAGEEPLAPHEVFLKVCWHLSRDVREGLIEYSLPASMREKLLEVPDQRGADPCPAHRYPWRNDARGCRGARQDPDGGRDRTDAA